LANASRGAPKTKLVVVHISASSWQDTMTSVADAKGNRGGDELDRFGTHNVTGFVWVDNVDTTFGSMTLFLPPDSHWTGPCRAWGVWGPRWFCISIVFFFFFLSRLFSYLLVY
jgi:hypothetical protein